MEPVALAQRADGAPSVRYLWFVRWQRAVAEGRTRRATYAAKRARQRDAVLSSMGVSLAQQSLANLTIDPPVRPAAPPGIWPTAPRMWS